MSIKIIACVGKNRELGKDGDLCFHLREDMAFFRETTTGHPVLMGYKTWLSLGEKPLKNRKNYVLTHHPETLPDTVTPVADLTTFLENWLPSTPVSAEGSAQQISEKNSPIATLFIIGGASLYKTALPYADEIFLTELDANCENANVFFPDFDKSEYNRIIIKESSENDLAYTFVKYQKK